MNDRAPYTASLGAQRLVVKNDRPMSCRVGQALRVIVTTMRARITRIAVPAARVTQRNVPSASCARWRRPRRTASVGGGQLAGVLLLIAGRSVRAVGWVGRRTTPADEVRRASRPRQRGSGVGWE